MTPLLSQYPGRWWRLLPDGRIECRLCPRFCKLQTGQRGFCFVRQREGDTMVLATYGRSSGFCVDPIEKKPLHHFFPGISVLSFGTAGCNLGCRFCQNWDISKARDWDRLGEVAMPEQIVETAHRLGCRSVAFTYNDPVIFAEYAIDVAEACRAQGIQTVAVTAGYITPEARPQFYRGMDAANVDLKAFTEGFYHRLCAAQLAPVLETLVYLRHETQVWLEVTTLLIPGENESDSELHSAAEWFAENLGPDVPWHFTAFHPDFKMRNIPPTPEATLARARRIALSKGLHYVYTGNVHDSVGGSTWCPGCGQRLIERDWYRLGEWNLTGSRCAFCGYEIAGHFQGGPGHWGGRTLPVQIVGGDKAGGDDAGGDDVPGVQELGSASNSAKDIGNDVPTTDIGNDVSTTDIGNDVSTYSQEDRRLLLELARRTLESVVTTGKRPRLNTRELPSNFFGSKACFVTLTQDGALRGCMGSLTPIGPLFREIIRNTANAARRDPRFPRVNSLEGIEIGISVLTEFEPLEFHSPDELIARLRPHQDGVVLRIGDRCATYLPKVWDDLPDPVDFLNSLSVKAGCAPSAWSDPGATVFTYQVESFSESDL